MTELIRVGIGELRTAKAPSVLSTVGLGSCVGVAIWDPVTKIGGLAHIMLPDSTRIKNGSAPSKFADTGIQALYDEMLLMGAVKGRLIAKLAGGASMFDIPSKGNPEVTAIGDMNTEAAKAKLKELGIRLAACDTGKNYGRTVELHCSTGEYIIKVVGRPPVKI